MKRTMPALIGAEQFNDIQEKFARKYLLMRTL